MSPEWARANRRQAMKVAAGGALLPLALPGMADASEARSQAPLGIGRDQPFDLGWRFLRGAGDGLEVPSLDDSAWRIVDLPHDWSVEDLPPGPGRVGPFDENAEGGASTGFTVGGEGWYRKTFRLAALPPTARAEILFDGVYRVSDVWLNGQHLGTHVHGYTPFSYDLTPHLAVNGENVLAVRVRNLGQNSRWYSGSGIYRQVTVDIYPQATRVARWGIGAWTRRITEAGAEIDVATQIEQPRRGLMVRTRLREPSGRIAAEHVAPGAAEVRQTLTVASPRLWSPETPSLYALETELVVGGKAIDQVVEPFGVRIIAFDAEDGMSINGKPTKLRGGCVHHDNGILGARAFPDAEERRVLLLKGRGFNAVRSSHNPTSRAFRLACDRHGLMVIEEAFDMWHAWNKPQDYSTYFPQHWQADLGAMVLSARNSPSVIMWSIGNEIAERGTREGLRWSWRLANEVHKLDPTRPVTAGIHSFVGRSVVAGERTARRGFAGQVDETSSVFLDVVGYNYKLNELEAIHAKRPRRIIYASETYPRDVFAYAELMRRHPWFVGEFVWTAMDYLGEAGIGATVRHPPAGRTPLGSVFPWVNAFCGDIDLVGEQKPQSLARDVAWGISPLEMLVWRPLPEGHTEEMMNWGWPDELPSWTWPGFEGKATTVRVYTSGDRVDLRLNDRLLASRQLSSSDKMTAEFSVPYQPGTLEAIAYRAGTRLGRRTLATVSAPAALRVRPEKRQVSSARQTLSYVRIELLDANGRLVPEGEADVRLNIDGPAELVAFGSAGPFAGTFMAEQRQTWRGRALAILRSQGSKGIVRIEARSPRVQGGNATIKLQ